MKTISDYLQPYIKSTQIFKCPSDSTTNAISYGYNYYYLAQQGNSAVTPTVSLAAIQTVSQTLLMMDGIQNDVVYPPEFWPGTGLNAYGSVAARHLETVNTLWCDGHVKAQRVDALKTPAGCTGVACDTLWDLN